MPRYVLCVRANDDERKLMQRAAKAADLALGTWLRMVGLRVARETLAASRVARAVVARERGE